jgi:hypothetical protein
MKSLKQRETSLFAARPVTVLFLLSVFLIGLGIRLIGLNYGSPLIVHPDEENIVKSALRFTPQTGFDGVAYNRPAQILVAANAVFLRIYSQLRWSDPLYMAYYSHEFELYVAARFVTAVLGALIPLAAYFIGKQFKPDFSIPAALIFCLFPSFIKHSHFVTPDISITLWTLMVMLFSLRYAQGKEKNSLWLAVFFTAVNTADKYPGIISSVMVLGALILRFKAESRHTGKFGYRRFTPTALACIGSFFVFLFIVAPNLYLHFDEVIKAIIHESNPVHLGADGLPYHLLVLKYLSYFISNANWVLIGLVIVGTVALIRMKQIVSWFLLYGVLYILVLSVLGKNIERWALPMYTSPLLIASFGAAWLLEILRTNHALLTVVKLIFLFGLGLMTLAGLSESLILSLPDTRVVATPFLEKQGIVEAKSYYDGFSPFSPRDFPPDRRPNLAESANYRYAIFSSYQYQLFFDNPQRSADQVNFYKQIRQNAELLMEYRPFTANTIYDQWLLLKHVIRLSLFKQEPAAYYTGPVLQIYQLADQ